MALLHSDREQAADRYEVCGNMIGVGSNGTTALETEVAPTVSLAPPSCLMPPPLSPLPARNTTLH